LFEAHEDRQVHRGSFEGSHFAERSDSVTKQER